MFFDMQKHLKDFFIPHEGNEYTPHSLQKIAVFCMGILILLSFILANLHSVVWITSDWLVSTILPAVIVDLTNQERESYALTDLRRNATLDLAATLKAQHMANNQYFAHYAPDGTSPWHWFSVADYKFVHAGENLAIHFSDSDAVVNAWMNSPTHKANIVNGNFTEIGVGTAQGMYEGYQTVYVVQLFGAPARTQVAGAERTITSNALAAIEEEAIEIDEISSETTPVIASAEGIVEIAEGSEVFLSSERDPVVARDKIETPIENETIVDDVIVHESGISVYSDLVSTSSGAAPAIVSPVEHDRVSQSTSPVYSLATRPQTVLQILYGGLGIFVTFLLFLSVVIEIRRQQPVQIAYSAALLCVMGILFYAHILVTNKALIV